MTGQWFGQWAGNAAGEWWGADETPAVVQTFTSAGGWNKDWGKTYGPDREEWIVKTRKGKRRKFKTAAAAFKAAEKSAPESVTFAGVNLLSEFRKLIEERRDHELLARNVAAELAAIEMHARRIAAERDDEEALLLLLH